MKGQGQKHDGKPLRHATRADLLLMHSVSARWVGIVSAEVLSTQVSDGIVVLCACVHL